MKVNEKWHRAHPMPKHSTIDQRIAWHLEHVQHCTCRGIPEKLKAEMEQRHIKIPEKSGTHG